MKTLSVSELSEIVSKRRKLDRTLVEQILREFIKVSKETIKAGDKISISGFGVFYQADCAQRTARNPHTGEPVIVPRRFQPRFTPSEAFKKFVSQK